MLQRTLIRYAQSTTTLTSASVQASHSYRYNVAVAWQAKQRRSPRTKPVFDPTSACGQWVKSQFALRPDLPPDSGEDSFCVNQNSTETIVGVSDGVGGWNDSGVDPSAFSTGLMYHCSQQKHSDSLEEILRKGYEGVMANKAIPAGSATACLLRFDKTGAMKTINLGDSGFVIYKRPSSASGASNRLETIFTSPSQTHYFNCPRQLTKLPSSYTAVQRRSAILDQPADSDECSTKLEDEDIVLVLSDGIIDNVSTEELEEILYQSNSVSDKSWNKSSLRTLVDNIIRFATTVMQDQTKVTPFTLAAKSEARLDYPGGKEDDATVIAIHVKKDGE